MDQLDGTDTLKFGIIKTSELRTASKPMMEVLMPLLFLLKETSLLLVEKIRKLKFLILVMFKSHSQFMMLDHQLTV